MFPMYLVWTIVIGILAGWLAGKIMRGKGFGILVDLLLGIVGAFLGGYIFAFFGLAAFGLVGRLIVALVGALLLLFPGSRFEEGLTTASTTPNEVAPQSPASSAARRAITDQSFSPWPRPTAVWKRSWTRLAIGMGTPAASAAASTSRTSFKPSEAANPAGSYTPRAMLEPYPF